MPRGRVARRSFQKSPGRLTEWFPVQPGEIALGGASFVVTNSLNAAGLAKRPFTITRTVGLLAVRSDQVVATELPFGALGLIVVSEKASTTGATAIPDPITEQGSDEWFAYQAWAADGAQNVGAGQRLSQYSIDSRAQRKVQDGEDIVVVMANGAAAAEGCIFVLNLRILVKLS